MDMDTRHEDMIRQESRARIAREEACAAAFGHGKANGAAAEALHRVGIDHGLDDFSSIGPCLEYVEENEGRHYRLHMSELDHDEDNAMVEDYYRDGLCAGSPTLANQRALKSLRGAA